MAQAKKHKSPKARSLTKTVLAAVEETKASKKGEKKSTEVALIEVDPKALQVEVASRYLALQSADSEAQAQIEELTGKVNYYRQEAVSRITLGVYNAANADDGIDIYSVYGSGKDWREALQKLYVALGFKNPDGSWTKDAAKVYHNQNANETERATDDWKKRQQRANNLATLLKKAAKASVGMFDSGAVPSFNDEKRTLALTNAPKAIAGKAKGEIDLTGDRTPVKGAEYTPSIDGLKAIADAKHAEPKKGAQGKATNVADVASAAATDEETFGELVNMLITTIRSLEGRFTAAQRKHLENLWGVLSSELEQGKDVA